MRYTFHFATNLLKRPHEAEIVEAVSCFIFWWVDVSDLSYDMQLPELLVLSIIQEKVNNPSPDDPFEPDIAAVSVLRE
jgi:hypothetical protein